MNTDRKRAWDNAEFQFPRTTELFIRVDQRPSVVQLFPKARHGSLRPFHVRGLAVPIRLAGIEEVEAVDDDFSGRVDRETSD